MDFDFRCGIGATIFRPHARWRTKYAAITRIYPANRSLPENQTVQKGKFPVIGFVRDPTGVAALYLAKQEGESLITWEMW